jgi:cell fate regulator YaaT (PSP1 superfamily)
MKCLLFSIEEIQALLVISAGEVQRYSDIIKTLPAERSSITFEILKAKYEGRVKTFEEMLKFGKEIDYND